MYKEYAQLIVYRSLPKDSILCSLCAITRDLDEKKCEANELIDRIHTQIKALLDLSTRLGFNSNLWHCYLTWLLLTNENSFTLIWSRLRGAAKHYFYSMSRSMLVNGLTADTVVDDFIPWWQPACIALCVSMGVLALASGSLFAISVVRIGKKRKNA